MSFTFVIIAALIAIAIFFKLKKGKPKDIDFPVVPPRKGLFVGYYGGMHDQAEKTKGYINVWWECQFQGHVKSADNIVMAGVATVISLGPQLFERFQQGGRNHRLHPNAEQQLTEYFEYLRSRDALQFVKAVTPFDEPNTNVIDADSLRESVMIIHRVAAKFSELNGLKLAIIYAAKPKYWDCIELFDFVGVDDYEELSGFLVSDVYKEIKALLRPDQKMIILPGGAFGQDLIPFIRFAHGNEEVGAILAFTWLDPIVEADKWIGLGNDANPKKQQYLDEFKQIVDAG